MEEVRIYATDPDTGRRSVLAEVCSICYNQATNNGETEAEIAATLDNNGEMRYSFGVEAGYYCDDHWRKSGYKGSTPDTANEEFDPDYAGEQMEED